MELFLHLFGHFDWLFLFTLLPLLGAAVGSLKGNAFGLIGQFGPGGTTARKASGREAASQAFAKGAVLLRSSGRIAVAAADPVADIIGVAIGAASGTTDNIVEYWPASPGVVFSVTLEDKATEGHALVVTNMYVDFALQLDDDGIFYADENDSAAAAVIAVGPVNDDDITNAKVRARILVTFLQDVTVYDT